MKKAETVPSELPQSTTKVRDAAQPLEVGISVIIPAHNEEEFLPHTLEALQQQTYRNFEVVVVTNGCTDQTAKVAEGKCDQLFDLDQRGLGKARNLGGLRACGEILLFLDAD